MVAVEGQFGTSTRVSPATGEHTRSSFVQQHLARGNSPPTCWGLIYESEYRLSRDREQTDGHTRIYRFDSGDRFGDLA